MVAEWASSKGCSTPAYANDGSVIRDWSHLLLSRGEFKAALEETPLAACAELPETVTQYVYDHSDLNRVPYEDVIASLGLLPDMQLLQVGYSAACAAHPACHHASSSADPYIQRTSRGTHVLLSCWQHERTRLCQQTVCWSARCAQLPPSGIRRP